MVVGGKGGHGVSIVWDGNVVQQWDRSLNLIGRDESHDTDLGKTSIVEFGNAALGLLLIRSLLAL